jgi:hypothetical protein
MENEIDLDLNALAPKSVRILYEDRQIMVAPFDLPTFAKFYSLSNEMQGLETTPADSRADKVVEMYGRMDAFIKESIPDFAGVPLNQVQLIAIFQLLGKINTPTDKALAALEKRDVQFTAGGAGDPKDLTS